MPSTSPAMPTADTEHGVQALDAGYLRPMLAAIHLVIDNGEAALIDTGVNASVPRVLDAIDRAGLPRDAVKWVMLTHVHLDHAGGAGQLMRLLPQARLTVHPRGAPHMRDPARLVAGTEAVYGVAATQSLYGRIEPVPPERVLETPEGTRVRLGSREFEFLDTPGHARHHVCILDHRSGAIFTGDTFGLCYRELEAHGGAWVFPSTTPVQFDPDELHRSIERIVARRPPAVYLTHFGRVDEVERRAADLHRLIDAHAALARESLGLDDPVPFLVTGLRRLLHDEARRQQCTASADFLDHLFGDDIRLNADGLLPYRERLRAR